LVGADRRFKSHPGNRHFERDPISYALETDWPVGAAGLEPLHIRIGICQDSQPGARPSSRGSATKMFANDKAPSGLSYVRQGAC
jgi:hypothetical protein